MSSAAAEGPIGVMAAMPQEMAPLLGVAPVDGETVGGQQFVSGRIGGRSAVFAITGIGKVNAASAATLLLSRYRCRALLLSGTAGGLDERLRIGDVAIGTRLMQYDYGRATVDGFVTYQAGVPVRPENQPAIGYELEQDVLMRIVAALDEAPLPTLSGALTGGEDRVPQVHYGPILSGDAFINDEGTRLRLTETHAGLAVEMESGAAAQVAERFGVPCVNVRCVSDLAGSSSHVDFRAFLPIAARVAAAAAARIAAVL